MVQIRRHRRRRIYCDVRKADDRGFAWFILVALSPALARILSFCRNFFTTRRVQTCTSRGLRDCSNYNNIIIYYIMRVGYVRACKKLRSTKRFKRRGKTRFFFFLLCYDDDDNGIDSDRGPLMRRSTACHLQVVLQPDFGRWRACISLGDKGSNSSIAASAALLRVLYNRLLENNNNMCCYRLI